MLEPILMIYQAGVASKWTNRWTNDSQRFLLEHFDMIHDSPSHIYHPALQFCPSSSWLQLYYSAEFSLGVKVVKGLPVEWGMCYHTVMLDSFTQTLSYHNNTVAVGSKPGDIIILNTVTGSQTAVLSGHTDQVHCLTFSSDGTLLVSGSHDKTVKLWDIQTGGVVKTFSGHTGQVFSVSISADCTTIASGSEDKTICLWNIHTNEFQHVISQQDVVWHIEFSPTDPKHFISRCDDKLWHWDTNGHQLKPPCDCDCTVFSPDGTQFVLCYKRAATVQKIDSGAIVAEFEVPMNPVQCCCFSPDGRLIAIADNTSIHIWDITNSDPHPVEILLGHTNIITSLAFPSSNTLISASQDRSVRFWQIRASLMDPVVTSPKSGSLTSSPIRCITLQAKDGIVITSDFNGMVKTWDISTGLCKASFQTRAMGIGPVDTHLINGRLILVYKFLEVVYVFDVERDKHLLEIHGPRYLKVLKISGDGSRVFGLGGKSIYAWSVQTGELMGEEEVTISPQGPMRSLTVDESKVWVHGPQSLYQGWDFLSSSSVQLSSIPLPNGSMLWDPEQTKIKNAATGESMFQLPDRFAKPVDVQCDGSYLVAGYESGEILILDLRYILL